jgi:hypothetical protein
MYRFCAPNFLGFEQKFGSSERTVSWGANRDEPSREAQSNGYLSKKSDLGDV